MRSLWVGWMLALPVGLEGEVLKRVANTTGVMPPALPAEEFQLERAFPEIRSFSQPVAMVTPPGESNRLFIVERGGRIRVIPDLENPVRETFLSMSRKVEASSGEQGLLGFAFHPDYRSNGTFFVFYTARGSRSPNRLSRFQVHPDHPNEGLLESEVVLFSQRDDAGNHNGGDLHFGPDGYLYVALGDEGAANDSLRNSQRLDRDFFAGILRIDVDKRVGNLEPHPHHAVVFNEEGRANYSIPLDNPYVGIEQFNGDALVPLEVRTEFWAVGLRNPWRMAFDPATGELYVGDVGQGRLEEVNLIVGGGNYGWNYREGTRDGPNRSPVPEGVEFVEPILEYSHGNRSNQGRSITGGVVYRGSRIPSLYGAYVFADYASGHIWQMRRGAAGAVDWKNIARETGISAFGVDPRNGDLLLADYNSARLRRLVPRDTEANGANVIPPDLASSGLFREVANLDPQPGLVPYSVNAPFWSDGAIKRRWFSVPDVNDRIEFQRAGQWKFPEGSLWVKHFELELVQGDPASRLRLETRVLVRSADGVYGVTYRWDDDQENAFLVAAEGRDEVFMVEREGVLERQTWRYPGRGECLACHTRKSGGVLGFNTVQLNRLHSFEGGAANQLAAYRDAGYFSNASDVDGESQSLAPFNDEGSDLTHRVRSYLHSNCSQCHQPGGEAIGLWDARFETPLSGAGILGGALANPAIHPGRRLVVPGNPQASEILRRMTSLGNDRMPPLGSNVADQGAIDLMRQWITESFPAETYGDWAARFFGSARDPRAARENDHDGDGSSNLWEFRLGTDPLDADEVWRLSVRRVDDDVVLEFPRIASGHSILAELQSSPVLGENARWQVSPLEEPSPFVGLPGERGVIRRRVDSNAGAFFRVAFREP